MNNFNSNFLENDSLDDINYTEESSVVDEQSQAVLTEAVRRIQQAKLYEAMLNHKFFAPGSADPDIISAVQKEFKGFIMHRLEVLLGIRTDVGNSAVVAPASSPFSDDEIAALKAVAKRLVDGQRKPAQPTVQSPTINPVTITPTPAPAITRPAQPAAPKAPRARRQRSNNVDLKTGQDYSQAVNPSRPPLPMPSQAEMDAMNARQANSNAGSTGQQTDISRLLSAAAGLAIQANAHIKEE